MAPWSLHLSCCNRHLPARPGWGWKLPSVNQTRGFSGPILVVHTTESMFFFDLFCCLWTQVYGWYPLWQATDFSLLAQWDSNFPVDWLRVTRMLSRHWVRYIWAWTLIVIPPKFVSSAVGTLQSQHYWLLVPPAGGTGLHVLLCPGLCPLLLWLSSSVWESSLGNYLWSSASFLTFVS